MATTAARCVAVAYSGGRDSTALLHATLIEAGLLGIEVIALHVHHGLSPHADEWVDHCEDQCRRWARRGLPVRFRVHRLRDAPAAGESVEAWARASRYRALATMAKEEGTGIVLLAHHQRDQAETFLLQALRGAGTRGLSAMPRTVERDAVQWQRPWLDRPSDAIAAYVRRHRLKHIVDDSNADSRFARNRLRLDVWPAMRSAFPQAEATLATAATWAQEADAVLAEVAQQDCAVVSKAAGLSIADWLLLSPGRRSGALRVWLRGVLISATPATLVVRLLEELTSARNARWLVTAGAELRLYRGLLSVVTTAKPGAHSRLRVQAEAKPPARESTLSVRREGPYALPGWSGTLYIDAATEDGTGVPIAWLAHAALRERHGSEQFQAGIGRPPRSLKKQFQAAGIDAWARNGPLVFSGGQLVFVPGLGLDARMLGLAGQSLVSLRWVPDGPAVTAG